MGKKAKRNQARTMNRMNAAAQEQFDYFKGQQEIAQAQVDETRADYEAFEFTNPFADAQNPFADIQTEFDNIYGGMENVYAGAQNVAAGAQNMFAGAQNAYAGLTNQFAGLENMYEGMENRFEDMTVDMRAAEFQAQQGQQQQANIMQGLRGAAGTSGVAGLAQAMASQGAMQSQQIAAGIGQQERQNQMLAAQEGSRIDQLQRGAGMQLQQLEATGAADLQARQAAGAMQTQQMQMSGAERAQQLRIEGAAAQQEMILGGEERVQAAVLAGESEARALEVSQENIQAEGEWAAEMAIMEGDAAVQAAEASQLATLLGMDYGVLAGANQGVSQAMANQMSGLGMQANMYGSQASSTMSTIGGIAGAALSTKTMFVCIPKGTNIDSVDKTIAIEDIKPGDVVIGYDGSPVKVLQKHEYLEDPTKERFYKVKFDNGSIVDVCDMHRIRGVRSKDITENVTVKEVYGGVEFSYDLLTEDLGYRIDSIPVNSMIEELALAISEKLKNK